jgi:hypothetical protein
VAASGVLKVFDLIPVEIYSLNEDLSATPEVSPPTAFTGSFTKDFHSVDIRVLYFSGVDKQAVFLVTDYLLELSEALTPSGFTTSHSSTSTETKDLNIYYQVGATVTLVKSDNYSKSTSGVFTGPPGGYPVGSAIALNTVAVDTGANLGPFVSSTAHTPKMVMCCNFSSDLDFNIVQKITVLVDRHLDTASYLPVALNVLDYGAASEINLFTGMGVAHDKF